MNELRDAALGYARLGWRVFPLHGVIKGRCTCGRVDCSSPGKHPLVRRGLHAATTDAVTIREWWRRWRRANVGVATGERSGIVVVDIDLPVATHSLDAVIHELPRTLTGLTGGGGLHLLYRGRFENPVRNRTSSLPGYPDLPGIDLRADGGYIVAPPSLHMSGSRYEWFHLGSAHQIEDISGNDQCHENDQRVAHPHRHGPTLLGEIALVPNWLKEDQRRFLPAAPLSPPKFSHGDGTAYGRAALERALTSLRSAPIGQRNHTLNRVAFAMAQLVAGGELHEFATRSSLSSAALAIGLSDWEVHQTLDSAFNAGLRFPRGAPHRVRVSS